MISKFMRPSTGKLKITKHILSNISRTEDNQSMKFGQLIECNVRNIFLQKLCRKWHRVSSSRPLFVFYKASYEVKASDQHLSFNVFWWYSIWTTIKTSSIKLQTVDPEICLILIFKKRPVTGFSNPFCVRFYNKNISHVIFYYLTNFIV